jgi:uncharacterized protein (TIGR02391 family)
MLTPRQSSEVYAAIRKNRLAEQEFRINDSKSEMQATHLATGYYFRLSLNVTSSKPASLANAILITYLPFQVSYTPNMLNPMLDVGHPVTTGASDWDVTLRQLSKWLAWIKREYGPFDKPKALAESEGSKEGRAPLAHLHPTVQQVASSRFASAYYSDAIQKACTALEKAVQAKSGLPATTTGTSLMTTAFSQKKALIELAADPVEQFGFMNLYQGAVQALRNHFAHNLTELTDPARAIEWLSFISALFYKLEETQFVAAPVTP